MEKKSWKPDASERQYNDVGNSFTSYLRDINRIPLLSKKEELETAKLAADGNNAAREKLITANLRFVVMIAKKYQGHGLPLEDLISEGNMGLLNAIKNFDVEKGYRFITYAVWWVRQAIMKAIHEKGRMIRLPYNKSCELAQSKKNQLPNEKELMYMTNDVLSLDEPLSPYGDSASLKDFIQDEFENSPMEYATNNILKEELEMLLSGLEERAAEVLRCRFGLGGIAPMTLREVGARYDLTRERVRQIENRAISQLESSFREHKLDSYIA